MTSVVLPMLAGRLLIGGAFRNFSRGLCADAKQAEVLEFLRCASRPKMGKAKAKQSAAQRTLDLTKFAGKFEDLPTLLRMKTPELKDAGVGCQERKRLVNFIDKYLQGYRHDGRGGKHAWKGWMPPYKMDGRAEAHRSPQ